MAWRLALNNPRPAPDKRKIITDNSDNNFWFTAAWMTLRQSPGFANSCPANPHPTGADHVTIVSRRERNVHQLHRNSNNVIAFYGRNFHSGVSADAMIESSCIYTEACLMAWIALPKNFKRYIGLRVWCCITYPLHKPIVQVIQSKVTAH